MSSRDVWALLRRHLIVLSLTPLALANHAVVTPGMSAGHCREEQSFDIAELWALPSDEELNKWQVDWTQANFSVLNPNLLCFLVSKAVVDKVVATSWWPFGWQAMRDPVSFVSPVNVLVVTHRAPEGPGSVLRSEKPARSVTSREARDNQCAIRSSLMALDQLGGRRRNRKE